MDLDDIHQDAAGIGIGDVSAQVPGHDRGLLFGGGGDAIQHTIVFGDLPDGVDGRVAGPQISVDDNPPATVEPRIPGDLDIRYGADSKYEGITVDHSPAAQADPRQLLL